MFRTMSPRTSSSRVAEHVDGRVAMAVGLDGEDAVLLNAFFEALIKQGRSDRNSQVIHQNGLVLRMTSQASLTLS